jgi:hypothetical protein
MREASLNFHLWRNDVDMSGHSIARQYRFVLGMSYRPKHVGARTNPFPSIAVNVKRRYFASGLSDVHGRGI